MGIITNQVLVNRGTTETSNFTLDVSGTFRVTDISSNGYMIIADSSGHLGIREILSDPSGSTYEGLFGDGTDGDVSIFSIYGLTKEMNYNNVTIQSGGNIYTQGYIVRVRKLLVIQTGGKITSNGYSGLDAADGGSGGPGAYTDVVYPEFGVPSNGGNGGVSGSDGPDTGAGAYGGTAIIINTGSPYMFRAGSGGGGGGPVEDQGTPGTQPSVGGQVWIAAGLGGDGNTGVTAGSNSLSGGGGGGGGGVCCVYAYTINNAGSITANGGNGGSGDIASGSEQGGGGGGGGAGVVLVHYRTTTGSGVGTLSATGGSVGTGGLFGGGGNNGVTMSCQI